MDAKFPNEVIGSLYSIANNAITAFVASGGKNKAILDAAIKRIEAKNPKSTNATSDKVNQIAVLEIVRDSADQMPDFSGMEFSTPSRDSTKMTISGVEISVYPDLILTGVIRKKNVVGAIKIHTSKGNQLKKNEGSKAALILRYFMEHHSKIEDSKSTSYKLCYSYDTFSSGWASSPQHHTQIMSEVTAACEEISQRWPMLRSE